MILEDSYYRPRGKRLIKGVDNPVRVGNNMRIIRTMIGLTQQEAADVIGTTQASLSYWERGIYLSPFVVELVAKCYNVRESFLYGDVASYFKKFINKREDTDLPPATPIVRDWPVNERLGFSLLRKERNEIIERNKNHVCEGNKDDECSSTSKELYETADESCESVEDTNNSNENGSSVSGRDDREGTEQENSAGSDATIRRTKWTLSNRHSIKR